MSTFAVGDIHGCFRTLQRLLTRLEFKREHDSLWLVGDLVNRGPRSLEVLRWAESEAQELGSRFVVVLGNHDLHLLAIARGDAATRRTDTLDGLLAAADRDRLVAWLAARPLLHRQGRWLMVHAGVLPEWTASEAEVWARRVEGGLASEARARELLRRAGNGADVDDPEWRALAAFTRMRALTSSGRMSSYTGPPENTPAGCSPWFERRDRRSRDVTIVAGHWAAAGLRLGREVLTLDTGAAWGGPLTAVRLDDRTVFQQRNCDL